MGAVSYTHLVPRTRRVLTPSPQDPLMPALKRFSDTASMPPVFPRRLSASSPSPCLSSLVYRKPISMFFSHESMQMPKIWTNRKPISISWPIGY